jgi:cytochrome P450
MATPTLSAAKSKSTRPPGPRGNFLLGSMMDVSRDWLDFYGQCVKDYGDIVRFRIAHVPVYLLAHPRDIESVLITNAGKFTKSADYRALARILGQGLLTSEGEFWRRQRGLIQPGFHRENIAAYAKVMTGAAGRMLDSWTAGEKRNIHDDLMGVTLEIVAQCLYSAEVSGAAERVGKAMEVVTKQFITNSSLALLFSFDIPNPFAREERKAIRELNEVIDGIIRERRASLQERGDLLDTLLKVRDENGAPMSDEQLRDEMMTLFLAGHETTALALSWACYLLAQHPQVEKKLVEELQTVLGDRAPVPEDLSRLRYTEMVVKEAMRLYPPAWGIGRRAAVDCEIGGYQVPKGTNIFILPWLTQRDGRFFADPCRFDPERWRDDPVRSGKIPRFAYFPFGGGPRVCVGAAFAMMEATLLLVMIQQRFHLELAKGHEVKPFASVTLRPKDGIHVVPRRRSTAE